MNRDVQRLDRAPSGAHAGVKARAPQVIRMRTTSANATLSLSERERGLIPQRSAQIPNPANVRPQINPTPPNRAYNAPRMKPAPRPALSPHRLARYIRWARLWLCWFGGLLALLVEQNPKLAGRYTLMAARGVANLVLLKAMEKHRTVKVPRRYGCGVALKPGSRRFLGARLRKPCATRDPVARFFATISMMRDFDTEVARFRKRITGGLMRWRSLAYAWVNDTLIAAPIFPLACADSS